MGKMQVALCLLWTSILFTSFVNSWDPISLGMGIGSGLGAAGIYAGFDYFKSYFAETCDDAWITPNMAGLNRDLNEKLHGQHLVQELVLHSVRAHLQNRTPNKPLVLSFHGWTGSGKNFVSRMITENIYKEGMKSQFAHWFIGTIHFPHKSLVPKYKDDLQTWIKGNVSKCELSMFVFDEVDKMPEGLLDAIKPFMDYYPFIDGVDYRRCIFIFLSNTGGTDITQKMMQFWHEGKTREDIEYRDFEDLMHKGAFNEIGGLRHTPMIEKNLIDYYIPFLPMERKHVKLCIQDELRSRGRQATAELVDDIVKEMPFFPDDIQLYSKVGCKRVVQKVSYILDNFARERFKSNFGK